MTRGSYLLIEPGMTVQGVGRETLGTVAELVADENADIFRGIVLRLHAPLSTGGAVFVPGEHITTVEAQNVFTDLNRESAGQLETVSAETSPII